MAVRQAAAAKWAQRRAAEARQRGSSAAQDGDDAGGVGKTLSESVSENSGSPNKKGRKPRLPQGAQAGMPPWDPAAYAMMDPYAMAAAFQSPMGMGGCPGYPPFGMYPPPAMSPHAMYPPGMFPGMGMPGFYGGMGDSTPMMGRTKSSGNSRGKGGKSSFGGGEVTKTKSLPSEAGRTSRGKKGKNKDGTPNAGESPGKSPGTAENAAPEVVLLWEDVAPKLLQTSQEEAGSKFLQATLDEEGADKKAAIYEAVLPEAARLAGDQWANLVLRKLLDVGTAEQKKGLVAALQTDLIKNASDAHGCWVVQKVLECASKDALTQMAAELDKNVIGCIESMHGNHVIQKCVERMPPDSVGFIIKAVEGKTFIMASHMYGCRVVQRLLEHCAPAQLVGMLDQILENAARLAQDPYGNYVVQHTLQHGRKEDKKKIIEVIKGDIVQFAKNKCSSNVVDKCFEVSTIGEHAQALEEERAALMQAVLGEPGCAIPPMQQMMDDRFGNYIVQRVIEHSRGAEREQLLQQLRNAEPQLRGSVKGKRILATLQREFGLPQPKAT